MTPCVYTTHNVKISLKISFKKIILNTDKDIKIKAIYYPNFIVIKHIYSFVIFKAKGNSKNRHCNVTKIPHPCKIPHAIEILRKICQNMQIVGKIKLENTTTSTHLGKTIDLPETYNINKKDYNIRFCSAVFPAVFLRLSRYKGTCLIFRSGKLILLGFNSNENIIKAINICNKIVK